MIAAVCEWLVVGGAAALVVEHEATRYNGDVERYRRFVGARGWRRCAEDVLRVWWLKRHLA